MLSILACSTQALSIPLLSSEYPLILVCAIEYILGRATHSLSSIKALFLGQYPFAYSVFKE
jgi:hypothetical protein